jgi:predicted patatin/cPLA2 family phospholipase
MRLAAQHPVTLPALLSLLVLSIGCAHVPKRNPLPKELAADAEVLGIPRARFWGDEPPPWMPDWWEMSSADLKARYPAAYGHKHSYLAISGGGENGAFAGGLLLGWSEAGDRPEFVAVTGISAGALIAPFAFLGTEYDAKLRKVLDELRPDAVFEARRTLKGLRSDAMASTEPLQRLIETYIDQEMMDRIAEEHRTGRTLYIGTANLDSMRPVIWRISAIANSGHPRALELIQKVLLASASIPGAFPPVLMEVQVGDEQFDELHVDGGAASQVFLYPAGLDWDAVLQKLQVQGRPKVYVIRNSRFDPMYEEVDNKLFSIAGRSIQSLVRTQGIGDLNRIYLGTCRDGLDFNLAFIPTDFEDRSKEEFDPEYMKKLSDMAFERAKAGYPWHKLPPELKEAPPSCR